ncbi:nitroreductase [Paenibacillus sp. FSL R7-0048]|jgi:nitroreductase|uniref:Nitroreductase n=1 Tax=Paenibacillus odorifer TaxID=189426 RepID=A0ABX3H036_9BACL|nr:MULTISPECIES: nitroreductase [Paenibacillus]MDH6427399.1 nitroreductase [Paenibacillus sp. PastH-4]MDH6443429.1 nitroreductase [Paenibacillus sp. PastF-4]MDH6525867.1 nitroreductase [Paenibacillus sp. PastH-3]OMC74578.1 nitroreductase [Paenibacillus odorifer]OMC80507.1 nitroreductase [Paenibacillus odorifer]
MKITELIKTRRSTKQFKQTPIREEELHSWLEAASYAPNHRMTEPWELLFIGPNTRAKLKHKTDFGNAPVVFAVLSKPAATAFERDENVMAAACFVQNFLLAAHEAGVGTYWASLGALPHNREILSVQENYDVIGIFGMGYPEEVPNAKPRTPISSKITYLS